jgi:hypothetical protein
MNVNDALGLELPLLQLNRRHSDSESPTNSSTLAAAGGKIRLKRIGPHSLRGGGGELANLKP